MSIPETSQLLRATRADAPRIAATLARAFHADPIFSYAIPDPDKRLRALEQLYHISIRYAVRRGEVYATSSQFEGAAVWLSPGAPPPGLMDSLWAGPGNVLAAFFAAGLRDFQRFMAFLDTAEAWQKTDAPAHSWYLMQLGVEPEHQGTGVGSQLLKPMFERCDRHGEFAYLETATPENVAFYEKRGFHVVTEAPIAPGGPTLWTMVRPPQAAAS
ncbi:MAG: GNAT family N-acetyltransferase [Chloroflexi bacterium]|nr:GNAT family N-acetyltransferase [Chloroflexota bacterium]